MNRRRLVLLAVSLLGFCVVIGAAGYLAVLSMDGSDDVGPPSINDISTDLDDPPELTWRRSETGRRLALPDQFKPEIRHHYADVVPLELAVEPDVVFLQAVALVRANPSWTLVREDADAGVVEGYATTRIFRFKDDFAIRLTGQDGGTRVDMRSKSRLGRGDLGVNAGRIRLFLHDLRGANEASIR